MSEILGTLFKYLLALLATAAVVVVLYESLSGDKTSDAVSLVTTLQSSVAQLYNGTNSLSSLSALVLIDAGVVPNTTVTTDTSGVGQHKIGTRSIVDPWADEVTVGKDTTTASDFDISLADVSQGACARLPAVVSSYSSVTINGGTPIAAPGDSGTIAGECTPGNTNTLTFVFAPS